MLLMGLVSIYEHHLSLIARIIIDKIPKMLSGKERTITLEELMSCESVELLKMRFVDKEIENIFREGPEKQIDWFESRASIKGIRQNHRNMDELLELFQRRNLFTHCNGIVNEIYISNVSEGYIRKNEINKGDRLSVDARYFEASLDLITEFGVKIIQMAWRKFEENSSDSADVFLLRFCYNLLINGEYRLALLSLEFALQIRGERRDDVRRMFVVNNAIAHALVGSKKESLKILDSEDWSASADNFKCCVAAVRGDVVEVVKLMKRIGKNGSISSTDYQEWPAFYSVRDQMDFQRAFKSVFGISYIPSAVRKNGIVASLGPLAIALVKDSAQVALTDTGDAVTLN